MQRMLQGTSITACLLFVQTSGTEAL